MTKEKIITIENVDFGEVSTSVVFTVPVGQSFSASRIVFRKNDVELDADGNGAFSIRRQSDSAVILSGDTSSLPAASSTVEEALSASPVIEAGDKVELVISVADTGDEAVVDIQIVGLITGEALSTNSKMYTDIEAVEAYTGRTITDTAEVERYIVAMTQAIDGFCNRVIFDDEVSTFTYDGDNTDLLIIKDVCNITEVTVDGISREFVKYPQNKPYASRLKLDGYRFTTGLQNVAVTGIHAMSDVLPEDVKFACTVLVAGILNNKDTQGKVGTTERMGAYSITYKEESQKTDFATAKASLSAYKRIAL